MKITFFLFLFMFAVSAFAEVPSYFPKEVTCQQLKSDLENYGSVKLKSKFLRWISSTTVYHSVNCGVNEFKQNGVFRTSEGLKCRAGVRCMRETETTRRERFPRCELNGNC